MLNIIKLTIEKAALSRGITTQRELKTLVMEVTGVELRAATISDFYRDNKNGVNKDHLDTIMKALNITDFNEVLTVE